MFLSLPVLANKYNLKIKGVIHVGAHHGQEVKDYHLLGIKDIALIEPCVNAFSVLHRQFSDTEGIRLFQLACGENHGTGVMHTETANKGQSNSLLEPADHTTQYPDIVFHGRETVNIFPLDALGLWPQYNFINTDCQGYEGFVYRGATETLKHIDYIYTEVNQTEVYKGCTKVDELDALLADFTRVETFPWVNGSWSDALYIKKSLL